jgi:hypothetical protein
MGYYYSARGWLELYTEEESKLDDDAMIQRIKDLIEELGTDDRRRFYLKPWCWPYHINWTHYFCYGADLQEDGVLLLEETLQRMVALKGIEINGNFHIDGEVIDSEHIVIRIKDNKIFKLANEQAHEKGLGKPFPTEPE